MKKIRTKPPKLELIIIKVLVHCVAFQFIQGRIQDLIYGGGWGEYVFWPPRIFKCGNQGENLNLREKNVVFIFWDTLFMQI